MNIFTKWKKKRGSGRDLSGKIFSSSRKMDRPNRRETIVEKSQSHVLAIVLWAVFFLVCGYVLLFSQFLAIGKIEIVGTDRISKSDVQGLVEDELSGKHFFLWPRNDFFAVRPKEIEEILTERYPLIRTISVKRIFPDRLYVDIIERKHIVLWHSEGRVLMADEDGKVFHNDQALAEENVPYVLSVTDMSAQPTEEGQWVADQSCMSFVETIASALKERLGLDVGTEYSVASRFSGELRMTTSEGWELSVNTELPIETTLDTLALLFEKELPAEKRSGLKYIDLRVENRVYYAFKDAPVEEPAIQTAESSDKKKTTGDEKKKKK
jgi:cell division septal protein FtsQ